MSGYIGNIPVPQATQTRQSFTATASQTTFNTAGYSVGYVDVFLNGVKLAPADYTATNGSDIVLAVGAASGDILEIVAYEIFQVVDQDFTGDFTVDGTTFVVDSTNNRVGIGTSSPQLDFVVSNNGAQGFEINSSGLISGGIDVLAYNRSTSAYAPIYNNASYHVWATSTSERMRIDSSGNLLVGTTDTDPYTTSTTSGISLDTNGRLGASYLDSAPMILNRRSSDGTIAQFRKDGTTVGSIASVAGTRASFRSANVVGYLGVGSTDYYGFKSTAFVPTTTASYDLGGSAEKFKDLHLSGTAYLSGTSSISGNTASAGSLGITSGHSSSPLIFYTGEYGVSATERMRIEGNSIKVATDEFIPTGSGKDLGSPTYQWRDLYLSGGVFLGGTGSSNKLDDYEEGAWTPYLGGTSSDPTITYTSQSGKYVKVGTMVTLHGKIGWSAKSGGAGYLKLAGFPFNGDHAGTEPSVNFNYTSGFGTTVAPVQGGMVHGNNWAYVYRHNTADARSPIGTGLQTGDLGSSGALYFTITYRSV